MCHVSVARKKQARDASIQVFAEVTILRVKKRHRIRETPDDLPVNLFIRQRPSDNLYAAAVRAVSNM